MTFTRVLAVAILAQAGLGGHALAQVPCPEVMRLRNAAAEAWKKAMTVPMVERCGALEHASSATKAVVDYAIGNRELCGISGQFLGEMESYDRKAQQARADACAGRPFRPYPPEIIQR